MGYRVRTGGGILNVLRWEVDGIDARQSLPPLQFQHYPALRGPHHEHGGGLADRRSSGEAVPVVSRADYAATGFSAAHLSGTVLHGWHTASGVVVDVLELVRNGAPFVYAYYDGVDRVAHAKGLGAHYDAELRAVDRLVGDIIDGLPAGAALVVTADHGQVDVGPSVEVLGREVMDGVELLSGEGRFRWLHTRAGAVEDVWSAAQEAFGHLAWVRTREEAIEEGWFGGEPTPEAAERLGDVLLAPFIPTAFLDPADTGEQRLVGRHGSLTPAEMLVPLIAWTPGR
jgi:predicted AlkP superfamily pyrophosphatase or phosphodiesterase